MIAKSISLTLDTIDKYKIRRDNMSISDVIINIIILALLYFIFSGYLGERIADKLKIKWQAEKDEKLEHLRAEINHNSSVFTEILKYYSSGYQSIQVNRIQAIQVVWEEIISLRDSIIYWYILFSDDLEPKFNGIYEDRDVIAIFNAFSILDMNNKCVEFLKKIEKYRPFLNEQIWYLVLAYRYLIWITGLIIDAGWRNRNLTLWYKSVHIQSILNEFLDDEERKEIYSRDVGSFGITTRLLERKILLEISKIISGELDVKSNLSKTMRIQRLMSTLETETKKINKKII